MKLVSSTSWVLWWDVFRRSKDGLHFRAWFKEVYNLISKPVARSRSTQQKKTFLFVMELIVSTRTHVKLKTSLLFILKSSQTENYLQVVVLNFRKGADDMKEISFPVVTFVTAGVKYFNQFSRLQWHSRSSCCLPRWHCGRSCSRTDPRLKLPNPPPNTEHRLLCTLPAHTLG